MLYRRILSLTVGLAVLAMAACNGNTPISGTAREDESDNPGSVQEIGSPLYTPVKDAESPRPVAAGRRISDPIVVSDCRLTIFEKEEVPAQKDGVLLFLGTEIKPGEDVPADKVFEVTLGKENKKFRRIDVGDIVEKDQLLAILDDRLARDDLAIKEGKVYVSQEDAIAAEKTRDEAYQRFLTQKRLITAGGTRTPATSMEDYRGSQLLWETKTYEARSKVKSIEVARLEMNQANTQVKMHEIRAAIPGVIMQIYKRDGESVKNLESVLQLHNLNKLRVEGRVDAQYVSRLIEAGNPKKTLKAIVEPSELRAPRQTLFGHREGVTSVAVARNKDNKMFIVSTGEDGTVRVADPVSAREIAIISLKGTIGRALACSPPAAKHNYCLCGADDGVGRLWDVDAPAQEPKFKLEKHQAPIRCVGFSPDGDYCATGGEDRRVCVWETATGKLVYCIERAHKGPVTSLQFTRRCQLVTAGRDNNLRVWDLGKNGAHLDEDNTFPSRSGDVTQIGVSPDGRRVLFDHGKELQVLSLPKGLTLGTLQHSSGTAGFSTFALFSPDGKLVLTADGGTDGRVELWRAPDEDNRRGYAFRQLLAKRKAPVTCAAFAPDGSFIVTGSKSREVLVWDAPTKEELDEVITAEVSLVEQSVESSANQVRIWAELKQKDGRLLPNATVTLVIDPGA